MNKKFLLLSLITLTGMSLNAQPVSKSIGLGGNLSIYISNEKINGESNYELINTYFRVLPKVSYYFSDHLAIGLQTGIEYQKSNISFEDEFNSDKTMFSIAPFIRYYVTSGKAGFFAEGQGKMSFGKIKQSLYEEIADNKIGLFSIGISPGLYYYISPRIALEFSAGWLGYTHEWETDNYLDEKRIKNSLGFNIETTGLSLGATFTL